MKLFNFYWEDKKGNLLKMDQKECLNKKHAMQWANELFANASWNDLKVIKTRLAK